MPGELNVRQETVSNAERSIAKAPRKPCKYVQLFLLAHRVFELFEFLAPTSAYVESEILAVPPHGLFEIKHLVFRACRAFLALREFCGTQLMLSRHRTTNSGTFPVFSHTRFAASINLDSSAAEYCVVNRPERWPNRS